MNLAHTQGLSTVEALEKVVVHLSVTVSGHPAPPINCKSDLEVVLCGPCISAYTVFGVCNA